MLGDAIHATGLRAPLRQIGMRTVKLERVFEVLDRWQKHWERNAHISAETVVSKARHDGLGVEHGALEPLVV